MANNDYITTDCKLTVSKNTAKLDEEIFLYKNDRNIKLLIEIVDNKYRYKSDDLSNLLSKYKASYAQVKWYKNAEVKKEFPIQPTDDGKVVFIIEGELINEDTELGDYDLQLRLLNENQESIRSLPIIKGAVHILKPLFEDGDIATVNSAVADRSMLSLDGAPINTYNSDGTYNQTNWGSGDIISSSKLNKLEKVAKDNVDKVNKMPAKSIVEGGKIYLAKEDGTKLDSGTELPAGGSTIEVVNNLESDSTTAALSAAQGKALNTQYKDIVSKIKDLGQGLDLSNLTLSTESLTNGTKLVMTDGVTTKSTIIPSVDSSVVENYIQSKIDDGSLSQIQAELFKVEWETGYIQIAINHGVAEEIIGSSTSCEYTKTYIPIKFINTINIPTITSLSAIAYYDDNKNPISGVNTTGTVTNFDDAPINAYYVRFSHFKTTALEFALKTDLISHLDNKTIKNSHDIITNANNISTHNSRITSLENRSFSSMNIFTNNCEILNSYISNHLELETGFNGKTVILPVEGGKQYTFNKYNTLSSAAIYFLWRGENDYKSSFTKTDLTFKNISVCGADYQITTITAPEQAKELLITIQLNTYLDTPDTLCVTEGDENVWVGLNTLSKSDDKFLYDFYAHKRIEEVNTTINANMDSVLYPNKNKTLCTFGDSLTDKNTGGYVEIIQNIVGCKVINKGSSGAATDRLVNIVTGNAITRVNYSTVFPEINYSEIDIVTIMIGTNGAVGTSTFKDIPIIINNTVKTIEDGGTITYNEQTISTVEEYWNLFPNTYYGNVSLCIEWILWKNPNIRIYLLTPPPSAQLHLVQDGSAQKVRTAMREIGEYYGIEVINTLGECGISIHNIGIYSRDNTHMNDLGNKKLGTYFARKIFSK